MARDDWEKRSRPRKISNSWKIQSVFNYLGRWQFAIMQITKNSLSGTVQSMPNDV